MAVELNHTIVRARDAARSARWLAEVLGLPEPTRYGPFWQVRTGNGVELDYHEDGDAAEVRPAHYAFLVGEDDFDAILGRVRGRGVPHYADSGGTRAGEINRDDGGRGTYFPDPEGHWMEIITRPYGSG